MNKSGNEAFPSEGEKYLNVSKINGFILKLCSIFVKSQKSGLIKPWFDWLMSECDWRKHSLVWHQAFLSSVPRWGAHSADPERPPLLCSTNSTGGYNGGYLEGRGGGTHEICSIETNMEEPARTSHQPVLYVFVPPFFCLSLFFLVPLLLRRVHRSNNEQGPQYNHSWQPSSCAVSLQASSISQPVSPCRSKIIPTHYTR